MITTILNFITPFKPYIYGAIILAVIATVGYVKYLQLEVEDKTITITQNEIDKQNIIEGYESTIIVREKLASEEALTQEQKEVVIIKQNKYKEAITKRGEIKQNENECCKCTLVHFD